MEDGYLENILDADSHRAGRGFCFRQGVEVQPEPREEFLAENRLDSFLTQINGVLPFVLAVRRVEKTSDFFRFFVGDREFGFRCGRGFPVTTEGDMEGVAFEMEGKERADAAPQS